MKNKRLFGNALLLLTAIIWGSAFVAQRVGMETIEPITFNAARMALAAIVVGGLAFVLWRRDRRKYGEGTDCSIEDNKKGITASGENSCKISTFSGDESGKNIIIDGENSGKNVITARDSYNKNTVIGGICCGSFLALASLFQQAGIVYTTAGKAGFITAMYILLVPIIGVLFLGKKNSWIVWVAVFLGVLGMYFLCISDGFRISRGDFLVCICAVFFSLHILSCDHFVQLGHPIRISAIQFATATVISAVAAVILEDPTLEKLISALIPICYCGIMSGGLGYTMQMVGQKYTDPTVASLIMSLESVFAAITGALLLHEKMSFRELLGCGIMFLAIVLVQVPLPEVGRAQE